MQNKGNASAHAARSPWVTRCSNWLTRLAEDADTSRSRLLEQLVGQDHEAYERLTQVATGAEVSLGEFLERAVFLEHSGGPAGQGE